MLPELSSEHGDQPVEACLASKLASDKIESTSLSPSVRKQDTWSTRSTLDLASNMSLFSRLQDWPAGWALLDQLIVSGMRFATTAVVGRFCGPEDLALYALAFSAILVVSISHEALIAKPYQVFSQGLKRARIRSYSGSILMQMLVLAGTFSIVAFIVALGMLASSVSAKIFSVALVLTITFPGILLWEFVRRRSFAKLEMRSATLVDACLAFLQLCCLLVLGILDELTVIRALAMIGISSSLIGIIRLAQQRLEYDFSWRRFWLDACRNWHFGRWFYAGQLVGLLQAYTVPWLLTLFYSTEKTGILMACQTLVLISNPILLGLANWLGPVSVRTYLSQGIQGLNRLLLRVSSISCGLMVGFALFLWLSGEWLLTFTFGSNYAGYGYLVGIAGITAFGFSLTVSGSSGLSALRYPRVILYGTILGSLTAVLCLPLLVNCWGLAGAAWALAAGSLTSGCFHLLGYWLISRDAARRTNKREK